jgi:hypothetical protein
MNRLLKYAQALAIFSALNLQLSTADLQGAAFTVLAITNPTPAAGDNFGYSVAAVGTDRVLIGAWGDDTGANDAGAASGNWGDADGPIQDDGATSTLFMNQAVGNQFYRLIKP